MVSLKTSDGEDLGFRTPGVHGVAQAGESTPMATSHHEESKVMEKLGVVPSPGEPSVVASHKEGSSRMTRQTA